jgi:hypothetical protein
MQAAIFKVEVVNKRQGCSLAIEAGRDTKHIGTGEASTCGGRMFLMRVKDKGKIPTAFAPGIQGAFF